jgi:endonuclease G
MKNLLSLLLLLFTLSMGAQVKVDTIINKGIYKSYYSYALKEPLYVTYLLSKGGGDCDRKAMHFSFKKCDIATASDDDYAGSPYDKGHLANAEDFAADCDKVAQTFCYYNCMPQTVKLNRGIWKSWETKIRKLSQTQSVFVVTGGIYGTQTMGPNHIAIPTYCYKIVLNAQTKELLYCLLFPNDNSKKVSSISLAELKQRLGYELMP